LFPDQNISWSESSNRTLARPAVGTFAPWNFCSLELLLPASPCNCFVALSSTVLRALFFIVLTLLVVHGCLNKGCSDKRYYLLFVNVLVVVVVFMCKSDTCWL